MSGDRASIRVEQLLRAGLAERAAESRDPAGYRPEHWCGCLHHLTEHHGDGGPCSACGCAGFHPADIECPGCLTVWAMSALDACPSCGLTLDEIAERSARSDAPR